MEGGRAGPLHRLPSVLRHSAILFRAARRVYDPQRRVIVRPSIHVWLCLLLLVSGCATAAPESPPPPKAGLEFPPQGSRWIMKSTDQAGSTWLTTFTVLGEGSFQGTSVFRVADDTQVLLYDHASRNWLATLRQDQVRYSVSPNNGIFNWPLEVDKAWTVTYEYQDHQRGRRFPRTRWQWRIAAHETISVPGGMF